MLLLNYYAIIIIIRKMAKFGNVYQEAIGRRKKKRKDGRKHENIGNKRKKLNNIGNIGDFINT